MQADALVDLKTDANELSLWFIEDNRSNFEQIISAIASKRDSLANVDYALLELQEVSALRLNVNKTNGNSFDEEANAIWHRDIIELTVPLMVGLARTIQNSAEIDRVGWRDVGQWLADSISVGRIDETELAEGVRAKLQKLS